MKLNLKVLALLALIALTLAACATPQAEKGSLYVAGNKAKVATVVNMTKVKRCDVVSGTVAYGDRETYFGIFQGSAGEERIPLTQVYHNGDGCSSNASYDFISGNPSDTGWTKLESGTSNWITAAKALCNSTRGDKPSDLQKICNSLSN